MKDTWRLYWREAVGAALVFVTRILTAPKTPWENDEFLFAEAVRKFDPSNYHPHPPGYPLFGRRDGGHCACRICASRCSMVADARHAHVPAPEGKA